MSTSGAPPSSANDRPSFEEAFRTHVPFVWRGLRRLGVRDADLDDACQEVFLVVHRRLPEFEGRSTVRTWIYGICVRVASDWRRKASHRYETLEAEPPVRSTDAGPDDDLARHQARALLDEAVGRLDDDKRAVFVLFELEEVPMSGVASALEIPVKTAYARLYAGREQVQAHFARLRAREHDGVRP